MASCGSIATLFATVSMISVYQYKELKGIDEQYMLCMPIHTKTESLINEHAHLSKDKHALLDTIEEYEKYTHYTQRPSDVLKAVTHERKEKLQNLSHGAASQLAFKCMLQILMMVLLLHNQSKATPLYLTKLSSTSFQNDNSKVSFEGKVKRS